VVVVGVDDSVFASGEWDSAESVAVTQFAIYKNNCYSPIVNKGRNLKSYPEVNFFNFDDSLRSTCFVLSVRCSKALTMGLRNWTSLRVLCDVDKNCP